jgi:hypothetical protein
VLCLGYIVVHLEFVLYYILLFNFPLTSCISAVVLALFICLEVVSVTLTSRVDELLAISGLGVEPPPVAVGSTVPLKNQ